MDDFSYVNYSQIILSILVVVTDGLSIAAKNIEVYITPCLIYTSTKSDERGSGRIN